MKRVCIIPTPTVVLVGILSACVNCSAAESDPYTHGLECFARERFEDAAQRFEEAVRANKNDKKALKCLAFASLLSGDARRAREAFTTSLRLDPSDPSLSYGRSIANYWLRGSNEAISDIEQSIRLDPDYAPALFRRLYLVVGVDDVRSFRAVDAVLQWQLRQEKLVQGEVGEFFESLTTDDYSKASSPGLIAGEHEGDLGSQSRVNLESLVALASWEYVYERYRQVNRTISTCTEQCQENAVCGGCRRNDAITYAVEGKIEKAMECANDAIALTPDSADAYSLRAALYGIKREYLSAIADLNRALKLSPNDFRARFRLANLYSRIGDWRSSANEAIRAGTIDQRPQEEQGDRPEGDGRPGPADGK